MKYNKIRNLDISNGEGCGVSVFTQGCNIHCPHCFNKDLSCFAFNLHNDGCDVFAYSFLFGAFVTAKCSWLENEVKSVGGEQQHNDEVCKHILAFCLKQQVI